MAIDLRQAFELSLPGKPPCSLAQWRAVRHQEFPLRKTVRAKALPRNGTYGFVILRGEPFMKRYENCRSSAALSLACTKICARQTSNALLAPELVPHDSLLSALRRPGYCKTGATSTVAAGLLVK
jgi:hypothetical protein